MDKTEAEVSIMKSGCDADKQIAELRAELWEARKALWMNHGHSGMYGDDGEMQCGECLRSGDRLCDYKRSSLASIVTHVLKMLAEAREDTARLDSGTLALSLHGKHTTIKAIDLREAIDRARTEGK